MGTTPPPDGTDHFTPHQRATDWSFLRTLAARNDFDVYLTSENGVLLGVFDRIDPTAAAQASLDLGYGSLGGTASVQVQLVSGQRVRLTYGTPGQGEQQVAENDGTGNAMGTQSLGGATTVLRDANDLPGTQTPDVGRPGAGRAQRLRGEPVGDAHRAEHAAAARPAHRDGTRARAPGVGPVAGQVRTAHHHPGRARPGAHPDPQRAGRQRAAGARRARRSRPLAGAL